VTSAARRVAIGPSGAPPWVDAAVREGGAEIVPLEDADALVWWDHTAVSELRGNLSSRPLLEWVQLPFAGVEDFLEVIDDRRVWTCGKGAYSEPVAELALALALGGLRATHRYARERRWGEPAGRGLHGERVTIVGGGGIARSLLALLEPFGCRTTIVRRSDRPVPGADLVVSPDHLIDALADALVVVLAAPLTEETRGLIGVDELAMMTRDTWLINVARGALVDTDALVAALQDGAIGGAALDVTDPEPLAVDHPLWSLDNCVITPHVGNTPEMREPLLGPRIRENVRAYCRGEALDGIVDPRAGY
jgi:phosphoglycerate dehydrogenase-like enzyme